MSRPVNPLLKVVLGIVINPQKEILIALRPLHNPHGGLWEFPGGKLEKDETPFEALKRELYEEVGITVIEASPFLCVQHFYDRMPVELDAWMIETWEGTPYGRENQEIRWVRCDMLTELNFPSGNYKVIQQLQRLFESNLLV